MSRKAEEWVDFGAMILVLILLTIVVSRDVWRFIVWLLK